MTQMQGKTLRVSYPGDSGTGYTLTTRDDMGDEEDAAAEEEEDS